MNIMDEEFTNAHWMSYLSKLNNNKCATFSYNYNIKKAFKLLIWINAIQLYIPQDSQLYKCKI